MTSFDVPIASVVAIVISPFIGSFLALLALRLPARRPIALGRSACDECSHTLSARDLVPFASYAALRGKCRYCGTRIDPLHPLIEAGALAIAVWAVATVPSEWILIATCGLGWTLLTLTAIDWRTYRLPDALTLPLAAAGLVIAFAIDRASLIDHIIGAAAGFLAFATLAEGYRRFRGHEGLGLGDAKLLAAGGAWLGWAGLPTVVLLAAILGLAFVLVRRLTGQAIDALDRTPFGPALAAGVWFVWLYGPLLPG